MSSSRANSKQEAANAELFKRSFREEAREILTELEAALLELNDGGNNLEIVGRIFRGLHTIKGSGAMFGFERMAAFTHDLETAFDRVRNGQLEASAELIDLTLGALDQIGIMLEEEAGGKAADSGASARAFWSGCGGWRAWKELARRRRKANRAEAAPVAEGPMRNWRIRFAPGPDLLRFGANPLLFVRELGLLGKLTVRAAMDAFPRWPISIRSVVTSRWEMNWPRPQDSMRSAMSSFLWRTRAN